MADIAFVKKKVSKEIVVKFSFFSRFREDRRRRVLSLQTEDYRPIQTTWYYVTSYYDKSKYALVRQRRTLFVHSRLINHKTNGRGTRLSAIKLTCTRNNGNVLIWLQDGNIRFCLYGPKRCISRLERRKRDPALRCRHRYFKLYLFFFFGSSCFCFFFFCFLGCVPAAAVH